MTATTDAPARSPRSHRPTVAARRRDRGRLAHAGGATRCVFAGRNIEHIRQIPEKLLDVTLQPLMFVLLFAYVFGGAIAVERRQLPRVPHRRHPHAVAGVRHDRPGDRDRHRPHRRRDRPVPLAAGDAVARTCSGHYLAELAGMVLSIVVLLGAGLDRRLARPHRRRSTSPARVLLLLLFASAMIWIGTWIGLMVRSPDAVMGVGFIVVFPLTFLSSAFVPIDSLPTALQWIASWNPVSVMVGGVRELFGNPIAPVTEHTWPLEHPVAGGVPLLPSCSLASRSRRRCAATGPAPATDG